MILAHTHDDSSQAQRKQARRTERERFANARRAEIDYVRHLRQVAQQIGHIIRGMAPDGRVQNMAELNATLHRYSDMLGPWAKSVAGRMLAEVGRRDEKAWSDLGRDLGRELRKEIAGSNTGEVMRSLMQEQVTLITSLPLEAAQRVHKLTMEAIVDSTRANEIAKEIMRSGEVSASRAQLIARTEVGRTTTNLTMARALHVGSDGYIWRTSLDMGVRKSHKQMEGKFVKWDDPPTLDQMEGHAGAFPNCRCWAEPVLPDLD